MKDLISKLTNKILNETIEERANEVMEKLKGLDEGGKLCECGGTLEEGQCNECGMKEGEMEEGNAFGKAVRDAREKGKKRGDKFKVGGKDYTLNEDDEDDDNWDDVDDDNWDDEDDDNWDDEDDNEEDGIKISKEHMDKLHSEGHCIIDGKCLIYIEDIQGDSEKITNLLKKISGLNGEECVYISKDEMDDLHNDNKCECEDGTILRYDDELNENYILSIDGKKLELTEEKLIDIIEDIVILEEKKLKGKKPKGYSEYENAVKKSKKENDDYIKSVVKKIKDYLKDGSKGDFEMEPKMFPKGNGELAKMKTKKYTMSDQGKEFLDDFMHPGMEDLVPDEIQYDEDWVDDLIDGSSRTGNNPEWANAEETDLGKKLNKKRKAKKYHKAKMMAYRKSPQPVTDGVGESGGAGINIKVESTNEKQQQKLNEEFSRIGELMNYNKSTQ